MSYNGAHRKQSSLEQKWLLEKELFATGGDKCIFKHSKSISPYH